ncbi:alpha-glucosidase 2 [Manduca sexta]|uniref:alpha-glucosidase 2 n=1 Tax=Manduca sexta TaxID=7130 RepID=UPI0011839BFE|nr:alpha-glucosidase 2 [Manduca sexta]
MSIPKKIPKRPNLFQQISPKKAVEKQDAKTLGSVTSVIKRHTHYLISYDSGEFTQLSFLNNHVFRYNMSPTGEFLNDPIPNNIGDTAKITVKNATDYDNKVFHESILEENNFHYTISTDRIEIQFDKQNGTVAVYDTKADKLIVREQSAITYTDSEVTQILHQRDDEYFYGGGMQNGRFSHKGEIIQIVNTNKWDDGGVTSPCPFFWSTYGYGVLRNTWQPGIYDFGTKTPHAVQTQHSDNYFDAFFFINSQPKGILNDYYELTGNPIFMPEFAFYEAHLNSFNRDYWVNVPYGTPEAILFEDGEFYKKYQPNAVGNLKGILESLNGGSNNYQFSARAMIDRYKKHDIPLGWFVPNDGHGCGYGQTDSFAGDLRNLSEFANYARKNGVEVAIRTESKLQPDNPDSPRKGERHLGKEVSKAGVVAIKSDSFIESGYSYAHNCLGNASTIFMEHSKILRPFIITVHGWAGGQRHAGLWSGNQSGGQWENIRFHIPTFIGTGLSGQPVVGSDMDGIFGGGDKIVNIREYQWKTFTPIQLNMDGWGLTQKCPFSFDGEATNINRAYLKLKSMFMPYNYTIGYESTHGLPMIRAMFLEFPKEIPAHTKDSQYQFMWGSSILVAPIYNDLDCSYNTSVRNGVYLPDVNQVWIDFFTGEKYQGGKIYNNLIVPLWKVPVFVKDGAIIPMTEPNNNPYEIKRDERIFRLYPNGASEFEIFEDDGKTIGYLKGYFAKTKITSTGPRTNKRGNLLIRIEKTIGYYANMAVRRSTIIHITASENIESIKASINGDPLTITSAHSEEEFNEKDNVYYFKQDFAVNPYLNLCEGNVPLQKYLLIKIEKVDITNDEIHLQIKNYINESPIFGNIIKLDESLNTPHGFRVFENKITSTSIPVAWREVDGASYYEIERDGTIFSNIIGSEVTFDGFKYESEHMFRIRSVNDKGYSKWSLYIIAQTDECPQKSIVKDVKVICNIPCQPTQEVSNLTNGDNGTMWHTIWDGPGEANLRKGKKIELLFDLGDIYEIDKVVYTPREDAGNGTLLQTLHRYSISGKQWSPISKINIWNKDNKNKTIFLDGAKLRFMELLVLDAVGDFGSGIHMLFYKKVEKGLISSKVVYYDPTLHEY